MGRRTANGRADGWLMDGRAGGRADLLTGRWADWQTSRRTAGGWTDGRAGGQTDGQEDSRRAGGRLPDERTGWLEDGRTDGRWTDRSR
jgi:hypothetical protein